MNLKRTGDQSDPVESKFFISDDTLRSKENIRIFSYIWRKYDNFESKAEEQTNEHRNTLMQYGREFLRAIFNFGGKILGLLLSTRDVTQE